MTSLLTQDRTEAAWPAVQDRRRPGRIENASPELIALMRKPASHANRVRVALYDAPGFLMTDAAAARRPARRNYAAGLAALVASSVLWGMMFKMMVWAWG